MFKEAFDKTAKVIWSSKDVTLKNTAKKALEYGKKFAKSTEGKTAATGAVIGGLAPKEHKEDSRGKAALRGAAIGAAAGAGWKNKPKGMVIQSKGGNVYKTHRGVKVVGKGQKDVIGKGWDQNFKMVTEPSFRKAIGGGVMADYFAKRLGLARKSEKIKKDEKK